MGVTRGQRMTLAAALRGAIRESGHTAKWIAEEAGLSCSTMEKWVSGQAVPNAINLKEVCSVIGCKIDDLLGGV